MHSAPPLMTAEELLAHPIANARTELVRGRLIVREPARLRHGDVAARLLMAIGNHVTRERLGRVLTAETGFTLERSPDTVRAPDVAFICTDRWPATEPPGFAEMAPDLAVEVLSPSDRPGAVLAKISDYLEAGTRLVWVVDPLKRSARVYRADGSVAVLDVTGSLLGEDVIPGLAISLSDMVD